MSVVVVRVQTLGRNIKTRIKTTLKSSKLGIALITLIKRISNQNISM